MVYVRQHMSKILLPFLLKFYNIKLIKMSLLRFSKRVVCKQTVQERCLQLQLLSQDTFLT